MQILVNGNATEVPESIRMSELIQQLGLAERRLAVELNQALVPRSQFAEQELTAGDRIEIIQAVGGG